MNRETRITELTIVPEGESLFHEQAVTIKICDLAGGEFVIVTQDHEDAKRGQIEIDPDEWPGLRDAIDKMVGECRK